MALRKRRGVNADEVKAGVRPYDWATLLQPFERLVRGVIERYLALRDRA